MTVPDNASVYYALLCSERHNYSYHKGGEGGNQIGVPLKATLLKRRTPNTLWGGESKVETSKDPSRLVKAMGGGRLRVIPITPPQTGTRGPGLKTRTEPKAREPLIK